MKKINFSKSPKSPKWVTQKLIMDPRSSNTQTKNNITSSNHKITKIPSMKPKITNNKIQQSNINLKSSNLINEMVNENNKSILNTTSTENIYQPEIPQTFAKATAKINFPKKNQAIVINIKTTQTQSYRKIT